MVIQGISKVKALREKQSIKEQSTDNESIVLTNMRSEKIDSPQSNSLADNLYSNTVKNKSQSDTTQSQAGCIQKQTGGIEALTVLSNDAILSSFIEADKNTDDRQCVRNQKQCIKNQKQYSEKANTVNGLAIKDNDTLEETVNANEMKSQSGGIQKQTGDDYLTAILKLFGSDRTIKIGSDIGLVSAEEETYVTGKRAEKSYDIWDIAEQYKIINSFNVIGSDGVYLFNEDCIGLGILESDDRIEGYMFILKNYKTKTMLDEFLANKFDPDSSKEVSNSIIVKLADNPILYTNDEKLYNDNKKYNTHELDRFIEYIPLYILSFRRYKYVYHPLDNKNNIFILKRTG